MTATASSTLPPTRPQPAPAPRPAPRGRPGVATLLRELRDDLILLGKQEFALARTETARNAAVLGSNIGKAAAFGALALVGVLLILVGLSFALGYLLTRADVVVDPVAATATGFLLFGAAVTLIFAVLLWLAIKKVRDTHALPQRSLDSLNADANLAARAAAGR